MYKIEIDDKYEILLSEDFQFFKALRYGEEWRDLTGDNLALALVQKIQSLQEEITLIYQSEAGSSL